MRHRDKIRVGTALSLFLAPTSLVAQGRIPPECWLDQQDNTINTCKYCHTSDLPGAGNDDVDRDGMAQRGRKSRFAQDSRTAEDDPDR